MLHLILQLSISCTILYLTSISLLLKTSKDNNYSQLRTNENQEYDFIIVGAGSAGCVVANRLTENNEWNSLLLEAGQEEPLIAEIPGFYTSLEETAFDWNYLAQPDENFCLLKGRCSWNYGKVMGGTSTLSFMMYIRGHPESYNTWFRMGNPGWSYEEVLAYFRKSEDNRNEDILRDNPQYHSSGGILPIERLPYLDPNAKIVLQAFQEIGYNHTDFNAKTQIGTMLVQSTSRNGSRMSTNEAFIRPFRQRKNLFIKTQVYVTKILIDPERHRALGVEYTSLITREVKRVYAKKEVIISAGTIESPKLLMLSGIGPVDELRKHEINVIRNLSVGNNLQDHVTAAVISAKVGEKSVYNPNCDERLKNLLEYSNQKRGPLASTGINELTSRLKTQYAEHEDVPDVHLFLTGKSREPVYYDQFMLLPFVLIPKSRGFIRLNDTDPVYGSPKIYPRYFSEEMDMKRMIAGIRIGLSLFNTTSFGNRDFQLVRTSSRICERREIDSDEYWDCMVRQFTNPAYHSAGTCKMGPKNDSEAVVDPRLRVHGIENLRVVDASIMPVITIGNTMAPAIMIGEKASDLIKEDWL